MTFEDVLRVLRSYWRSILVTFLIVAVAGAGLLMLQPRQYTSSAEIYLLPRAAGAAGQLAAAQDYAASQARVFADLARGPVVLAPAAESLGITGNPTALVGRVSASGSPSGSINISVSDATPEGAQAITAAVSEQLLVKFEEYTPPGAGVVLEAVITSPAGLPGSPSSPNLTRNALLAMAIAAVLAVGQAFLRDYLDDRVEDPDDLARITPLRVVGEVPFAKRLGLDSDAQTGEFSTRAEAYRRARTNLNFLLAGVDRRSVLVTSSVPGEGKTETSSAIARAMGELGSRVLLIDADLRRPQVAKTHDLPNEIGLSTAILNQTPISDVVQRVEGVDIITSGPIPPNPSELLGSPTMAQLLEDADQQYDCVIVDSPPILPVTDATVLAQHVGGVLLVADATAIRRRPLRQALGALESVDSNVFGVLLNKIKLSGGRYGYGYGYKYGYAYGYASNDAGKKGKKKASRRGSRRAQTS